MVGKFLLAGVLLLVSTGLAPPNSNSTKAPAVPIELPKPKDLNFLQQQSIFRYGTQAIEEQCSAQPTDLWCKPIRLKEQTLTPYQIMNISLDVKQNFDYLLDETDNWRVHTSEVLMKQRWKGDCDDLSSTTLDVMIRAGQPLRKIWLILADVTHTANLDHLVAMVQDSDGHYWIVGDTSAQNAYPADKMTYRVVAVARGDNMKVWSDPHSVQAFPASAMQSNPVALSPLELIAPLTPVK